MELQLRDLKYFETVATLGHMGQAGVKLGRTQPALTKSIQRLEQAFGSPLFERAGRGIRLTPVGEVLLTRARLVRASADEAIREVVDFAQGKSGHVRIGTGPIAADDVLPEICQLLLAQLPGITMEITVAPSMALREQLRRGQIDLLMGLMPEGDDEFVCHPIVDDVVVVAANVDHPVFALPKITMRSLLNYRWVLPAASIPSRQWLDAAFELRRMPKPIAQIEANSIPLLPRLIARTELLSFVSRHTMGHDPLRALKEVKLKDTTLTRKLGVSQRREGYLSPAAQRLLDLLRHRGPAIFSTVDGSQPLPRSRRS
jgi:DNA-binding transcriptional LysR family regulator